MFEVAPGGAERLLTFRFTLEQRHDCDGVPIIRLSAAPEETLLPGSLLRLVVSGTTLGISGLDVPENALTGPVPQPGGAGFVVDFAVP